MVSKDWVFLGFFCQKCRISYGWVRRQCSVIDLGAQHAKRRRIVQRFEPRSFAFGERYILPERMRYHQDIGKQNRAPFAHELWLARWFADGSVLFTRERRGAMSR
jgi:hypothetical protein